MPLRVLLATCAAMLLWCASASANIPAYFGGWGIIPRGTSSITILTVPAEYSTINAACNQANSDTNAAHYYVIVVSPGLYAGDGCQSFRAMMLKGADPLSVPIVNDLSGSIGTDKGIFLQSAGTLYADSFVLEHYTDSSGNGSGFRSQSTDDYAGFYGNNLTTSYTEMGIETFNSLTSYVEQSNNLISNSGIPGDVGAELSHGYYIGQAQNAVVRATEICGDNAGGNSLKSRAAETYSLDNIIYTAVADPNQPECLVGNGSYSIDLSNGGRGVLVNNTVYHGIYNDPANNAHSITLCPEGSCHVTDSIVAYGNSINAGAGMIVFLTLPGVPSIPGAFIGGSGNTMGPSSISMIDNFGSYYIEGFVPLVPTTTGPYGLLSADATVITPPTASTVTGFIGVLSYGAQVSGSYYHVNLNGTDVTNDGAASGGVKIIAADWGGSIFACNNSHQWIYWSGYYNAWYPYNFQNGSAPNPAWGTC